jgi:AraC-like DNA-binding protein
MSSFAPLRFSTNELPEGERLPQWREVFGQKMVRVDIEPLSDLPFCAEATLRALPGLRTLACRGSAVRLQRTRSIVADGDDAIGLIVNLGELGHVSQRDRSLVLGAGDAVMLLHTEPATLTYDAPESHLALAIPRSVLAPLASNIDDAAMRLIPSCNEALRLLVNYLGAQQKELGLTTPELRAAVAAHVHELVALALNLPGTAGENGRSAVQAARLAAVLDHIAAHFDEPDLNVAAVARSQGFSPRYLQGLLETSGSSFTERVTELRLQRAFALLSAAGNGPRRISDIALEAGFSDISHFNRLFRARFGDTPSAVRAQAVGRKSGRMASD